jgi:putative peptidoglycan lipid II flippase
MGHAGLTLATSLGASGNAAALFVLLRRRGHYRAAAGWPSFLLRIAVGLVALALTLHWLAGPPEAWLAASLWWRAAHLALLVVGGAGVYFAVLFLLGFRLRHFARTEAAGARNPVNLDDDR